MPRTKLPQAHGRVRFLTRRQRDVLAFIEAHIEEHGMAPTIREICDEFGLRSLGTVDRHLYLLEKKGFIHRELNQRRGIVISHPDYIRVEDRLPSAGEWFVGFRIVDEIDPATTRLRRRATMVTGYPGAKDPFMTHWMPIPEPPKED